MLYNVPSSVRTDINNRWNNLYFEDYIRFSTLHIETKNVDPVYPVLRYRGGDIWHTFLYLAWYDLASGEYHWQTAVTPELMTNNPAFESTAMAKFPTGVDRRNLRGGDCMVDHLSSLLSIWRKHHDWYAWLTQDFTGDSEQDFVLLQDRVQDVWGNGIWAGRKTAEVMEKVHDFPVKSSDRGALISPTSRRGLELFYGRIITKWEFIAAADNLFQRTLDQLSCDISEVETFLCDFYRCATGRFYSGKDTDVMLATLNKAHCDVTRYWEARRAVLPTNNLGELQGWRGVDQTRLEYYYYTKQIPERCEKIPKPETWPQRPWNVPFNWHGNKGTPKCLSRNVMDVK